MSDTPETDEVFADDDRVFDRVDRDRWQAHARRLERDLDAARVERDILRLDAQREAEHHDRLVKELESLYEKSAKLRDIAKRAIDYLNQSYRNGFEDEANELRAELDQLKEGGE